MPHVDARSTSSASGGVSRPRVPVTADAFAVPRRRAQLIADKGMMVLGFHSERHRDTPVDLFATEPFDFNAEYATTDQVLGDDPQISDQRHDHLLARFDQFLATGGLPAVVRAYATGEARRGYSLVTRSTHV